MRLNELNALRKQIEREYLEKVNLEDEIMEKMRSQLTMDKAAHYTKKLTGKRRDLTKQLVSLYLFMITILCHKLTVLLVMAIYMCDSDV